MPEKTKEKMEKIHRIFAAFCAAFICSMSAEVSADVSKQLILSEVTQNIDLSSQITRITTQINLENKGAEPLKYFLFACDAGAAKNLAWIQGYSEVITNTEPKKLNFDQGDKGNKQKNKLKTEKAVVKSDSKNAYFKIELKAPLKNSEKNQKVVVEFHLTHSLTPFPTEIAQTEKQLVIYVGNVYLLSPYKIGKLTTKVKLPPTITSPESYSKSPEPVKFDAPTITYGPYNDVEPMTEKELKVHYESNAPFLVVDNLKRHIEVSHWGNIAVEEYLEVSHKGAVLKGSFSRLDFQRDNRGDEMPAIKNYLTLLPAAAKDVYYRDEIGNISTSHMRVQDDSVQLDIRPRFPLFGGWKTNYLIGYNVASYEYLYHKGDRYCLKMRFVDHIFDGFVVDDMTLEVVLPEGASDITLVTPYTVRRSPNKVHYTYLDTTGRPVVAAHKSNLDDQHIQEFELYYTFDRRQMIREPFMVVAAFLLLFAVVIVWVRLDFTIAKDAASESKMKLQGLIAELCDAHGNRIGAYETWTEAINKYKTAKDSAALNSGRKKAEQELKVATQQISELQAQIKAESADVAEKLNDVQKTDKAMRDHLNQFQLAMERFVGANFQSGANIMDYASVMRVAEMNEVVGSAKAEQIGNSQRTEQTRRRLLQENEQRRRQLEEEERRLRRQLAEISRQKEATSGTQKLLKKRETAGPSRSAVDAFKAKKNDQKRAEVEKRKLDKERLIRTRIAAAGGKVTKKLAKQFGMGQQEMEQKYLGKNVEQTATEKVAVQRDEHRTADLKKVKHLPAVDEKSFAKFQRGLQKLSGLDAEMKPTNSEKRNSLDHEKNKSNLKARQQLRKRTTESGGRIGFSQLVKLASSNSVSANFGEERERESEPKLPAACSVPKQKIPKLHKGDKSTSTEKMAKSGQQKTSQQWTASEQRRSADTAKVTSLTSETKRRVRPSNGAIASAHERSSDVPLVEKKIALNKPLANSNQLQSRTAVKTAAKAGQSSQTRRPVEGGSKVVQQRKLYRRPASPSRAPPPPPPPTVRPNHTYRYLKEDDEDEYDSDLADFIDDEPVNEEEQKLLQETLKTVYKYDKRRFKGENNSLNDKAMESSYRQTAAEDARTARLGLVEDLKEYRKGSASLC